MSHRFVRRGTAVVTLVLALALAGAGPAHAASGPRAFEAAWSWLTGLWQAATGDPAVTPPDPDRGAGLDPDGGATAKPVQNDNDRGAGLDPDGRN